MNYENFIATAAIGLTARVIYGSVHFRLSGRQHARGCLTYNFKKSALMCAQVINLRCAPVGDVY